MSWLNGVRVVLGSSSKFRQSMAVPVFGVSCDLLAPDIDEKAIRCDNPDELVISIAEAKADAVLQKIGETKEPVIIVTGDQVIDYEGQILEKPETKEEARKFIAGYRKSPPITVSGICVIHTGTKQKRSGVSRW
jgi:septum formation protein